MCGCAMTRQKWLLITRLFFTLIDSEGQGAKGSTFHERARQCNRPQPRLGVVHMLAASWSSKPWYPAIEGRCDASQAERGPWHFQCKAWFAAMPVTCEGKRGRAPLGLTLPGDDELEHQVRGPALHRQVVPPPAAQLPRQVCVPGGRLCQQRSLQRCVHPPRDSTPTLTLTVTAHRGRQRRPRSAGICIRAHHGQGRASFHGRCPFGRAHRSLHKKKWGRVALDQRFQLPSANTKGGD